MRDLFSRQALEHTVNRGVTTCTDISVHLWGKVRFLSNTGRVCNMDWCQAVVNVLKNVHLNKVVNLQKAVFCFI